MLRLASHLKHAFVDRESLKQGLLSALAPLERPLSLMARLALHQRLSVNAMHMPVTAWLVALAWAGLCAYFIFESGMWTWELRALCIGGAAASCATACCAAISVMRGLRAASAQELAYLAQLVKISPNAQDYVRVLSGFFEVPKAIDVDIAESLAVRDISHGNELHAIARRRAWGQVQDAVGM